MADSQTAAPAAEETQEQVSTVAEKPQDQTPASDSQAEPQKPESIKETPEWAQRRINELTRQKYERQAEANFYKKEAERLAQAQRTEEGTKQIDPADLEPLIESKAKEIAAQQAFNARCNTVYEKGAQAFPDFDRALSNLKMVGGLTKESLESIIESDMPERVIHHLGSNLDEAARILELSPVAQARAIAKLEVKLSTPAPKPVSKAPAPIEPVGGRQVTDTGLSDDLPIDEWLKRRNAQLKRR